VADFSRIYQSLPPLLAAAEQTFPAGTDIVRGVLGRTGPGKTSELFGTSLEEHRPASAFAKFM
jgi:hypothetical protein